MNIKRILGIVLVVIGVIMLCVSFYISAQIGQGVTKITEAQKNVNTTHSLFSLSPTTKPLGDQFAGSAQKKISKGWEDIAYYQSLAMKLKIGGIIVAALGVLGVIFFRKKR